MKLTLTAFFALFILPTFALKPSQEYKVTPDKFGMEYVEEKIKTEDGAILNAWFYKTSSKTTNWIVMSGSGEGNMADDIEIVNSFLSAGYNVVTYDYRGYGSSSEFEIDPELYIYPQFIKDLNGVLDYLRKSRAITKFNLYGKNIGAGLSIGVGANRPETKKIIADGPWTSLEGMKSRIKAIEDKDIIVPFAYDKKHEPIYAFEKYKGPDKPILVIVSSQDPLIGPTEIKTIKGISSTYIVKNSPSNSDNFSTDKNGYFETIEKFLNKK
jgi:predicted alpha/beta-fold hydrolase